MVDGHGGFAEAGGDQLELAVVTGHVTGGEDVGEIGLHEAVDPDGVAAELEAPGGHGSKVGLEADEGEDGVDLERGLLVGAVVEDGDARDDALVAVDGADLTVQE
jgi:hypothetical protein